MASVFFVPYMKNTLLLTVAVVLIQVSCTEKSELDNSAEFERNKEAREDSIELAEAYQAQTKVNSVVYPSVQTTPVSALAMDDAADDPAFWFNQDFPDSSLIFGSNKKGGIYSYHLDGSIYEYYPIGLINNIDIRQGVPFGEKTLDIISGSNRSDNSIVIYTIDNQGKLQQLLKNFVVTDYGIDEVYGYCMGKVDELPLFLANGKNGSIRAFKYEKSQNSLILWNSWSVDTQPEGMVIDDEHQVLYVGEEQNGIWRIDLKSPESEPTLIISSTAAENENIRYDIEGLAVYDNGEGQGFLVASSQGNFTYAVFDRLTNEYLGSFKIMAGNQIDSVEETDGLEIYSRSLTDQYPKGILLVQDGFNYEGDSLVAQNFKLVNFSDVLKALED